MCYILQYIDIVISLSSEIKTYVCNFIYMKTVGMEFVKIIGMEWKNKPLTFIHMAVCRGIESSTGPNIISL